MEYITLKSLTPALSTALSAGLSSAMHPSRTSTRSPANLHSSKSHVAYDQPRTAGSLGCRKHKGSPCLAFQNQLFYAKPEHLAYTRQFAHRIQVKLLFCMAGFHYARLQPTAHIHFRGTLLETILKIQAQKYKGRKNTKMIKKTLRNKKLWFLLKDFLGKLNLFASKQSPLSF